MGAEVAAGQRRPATLSTFFGRERELAQLRALLSAHRMVTITGVGGVGKTRLALEVGDEAADDFPVGVWLVELARVEDPALVVSAIADAVHAPRDAETSDLDRAVAALSTGRQLIILDNCEHVVDAAAHACAELLSRCPALTVLATARLALGIGGEHVWPVPTLGVPASGVSDVSAAGASEAVQLFVDRARLVAPAFRLSPDNAGDVTAIARQLDGLPLALELTAAWVPVLSLKQIATRLDGSLALLMRDGDEKPSRHRTMRGALDWSYELLAPLQQTAFERLSVCVGGFTLETAEALLHDLAAGDDKTLELVAALVARSLIVADTAGDEARYRFLEPVRQYAGEHLRASPSEEHAARALLLGYLAHLADTARDHIIRGPDRPSLRLLDVELANIRVALAWGWSHDYEAAASLATSLSLFCAMRYLFAEGREWAHQALQSSGRTLARAYLMAGDLSARMADVDSADGYLAKARQLTRDGHWLIDLLFVLFAEMIVALHRGDLDTAAALCDEAQNVAVETRVDAGVVPVMSFRGSIEFLRGNYQSALAIYRDALPLARRLGETWLASNLLIHLGEVAVETGDTAAAREAVRDALDATFVDTAGRDDAAVAFALENAGVLAIQLGELGLGLRLMAACSATLARTRYGQAPDDVARRGRWIATAREGLDATAADAVWKRGLALTLDDATAEASAFLAGSRAPTDVKQRTFMFTDIVRSTELVGVIGDDAWHDLVDWHNRTLRSAFATYGGEEIDSAGDGFFVAFPDAQSAVDCAIDIQRTLAEHRRTHGFAPRVRVGLHAANATRSGGGYRGKGVHVAARIAAHADGDEILASLDTATRFGDRYARSAPRPVALKGVAGEFEVVSVRWAQ